MVQEHFGLERMPFSSAPDTSLLVGVPAMAEVLQRTRICVSSGSGIAVIVGQAGTGKSLLLEQLADENQDEFRIVKFACPRIKTRTELLQNILFEVGKPFRQASEGELRLSLGEYIKHSKSCTHGLLLLIDEAHFLSVAHLDELRQLTNIVRDGSPGVRLVLAGAYPLEERLNHPKLEGFNQRVTGRFYLNALTRDETYFYVVSQMQVCGRDGREVFEPAALDAIHKISEGVPRIVNQLCQHSLITAANDERRSIDAELINMTWSEIQCIPYTPPESNLPRTRDVSTVVEFGALPEEPAEPAAIESPTSIVFETRTLGHDAEPSISDPAELGPGETLDPDHRSRTTANMQDAFEAPQEFADDAADPAPSSEPKSQDKATPPINEASLQATASDMEIPVLDPREDLDSQNAVDSLVDELHRMESPDDSSAHPIETEHSCSQGCTHSCESPIDDRDSRPTIDFHHQAIVGIENPIVPLNEQPGAAPESDGGGQSDDGGHFSGPQQSADSQPYQVANPFTEAFSHEESVSSGTIEMFSHHNRQSSQLRKADLSVLESQQPEMGSSKPPIQFVVPADVSIGTLTAPMTGQEQPTEKYIVEESLSTENCTIEIHPKQQLKINDQASGYERSFETATGHGNNRSHNIVIDDDSTQDTEHFPEASIPVEYPIDQHAAYQGPVEPAQASSDEPGAESASSTAKAEDDRDMIVISQMENVPQQEPTEPKDEREPGPPPSQGRAVRVELKDLFKQLRSFENES